MNDLNFWMTSCGCSKPAIYWSSDFDARMCQNCGTIIGMGESEKVPKFVHMRVHTHLSLLKAICKTGDLIAKAKEYGMPAIAKTEYGNMFGTPTFIKDCQDADIKPIIGTEFTVKVDDVTSHPVVFIALNHEGYKNLVQMNTTAWCVRKGKDTDPFITLDDIRPHSIVALIDVNQPVYDERLTYVLNLISSRVPSYIEIHDPRPPMVEVAKLASERFKLPVIATGDVLYTEQDDYEKYGTALKIGKHTALSDRQNKHFKSPIEMYEMGFEDTWYANTIALANAVEDYGIVNKNFIVPTFKNASGEWSIDQAHGKLVIDAWQGLAAKGLAGDQRYVERLQYELDVMKDKKFSSYFLIIYDIIDYMKRTDMLKPVGRGSSVGSLVCYCLDIIAIDPIKWNVPFERFINSGRVDLPDIDTDITQEGRPNVLRYIADTHGHDRVAQIATFQTMALKASIDNVGRAMGIPHLQNRELRNKIPDEVTEMEQVPGKVKQVMSETPNWVDHAVALTGIAKNLGYHAAGIVISNEKLGELVPLLPENEGLLGIQYDMRDTEIMGLLKLDMLGLRNLDIIKHTLQRIENRHGIKVDIYNLPPDDSDTYDLITSGDYASIFQLDSPGYRRLCARLAPRKFEHIMALNALYRPGPLEGGMTDEFVERRHGRQEIIGWHPWLDNVLASTYQVPVYQEQVMAIAKIIAGFDDVEADQYRKAIGKKNKEKFDEAQNKFKIRALKREGLKPPDNYTGTLEQWIKELLDKLAGYARYGWNSGHSAGYGWITYITAYLETHFTVDYYAAILDSTNNPGKIDMLMRKIISNNITVNLPHINYSDSKYTVLDDNIMYMGLSSIKSCAKSALDIVKEREARGPFSSFVEFCQRMPSINKNTKIALVKSGAFDWDKTLTNRNKIDNVDIINKIVRKRTKNFDGSKVPPVQVLFECFIDGNEFTDVQKHLNEKEVLHSFVTGHPADVYQRLQQNLERGEAKVICPHLLQNCGVGESVLIIGMIDSIQRKVIQKEGRNKGKPYITVVISDNKGIILVNIWHPLCENLLKFLVEGQIAMFEGATIKDRFREDFVSLKIDNAVMLQNGLPIQGVFVNNGDDPNQIVNSMGGMIETITEVGQRTYVSIRGGRLSVMPDILDGIIKQSPESKFLLSMNT